MPVVRIAAALRRADLLLKPVRPIEANSEDLKSNAVVAFGRDHEAEIDVSEINYF